MSTNCDIDKIAEAAPNLLKALKEIAAYPENNKQESVFNRMGWRMQEIADKAIKKAKL